LGLTIATVDVYGYDLSYVYGSYTMSGGRVIDVLPSTVVRVTTTDGVEGFGEVCPLGPAYLPSHGEGARAALRLLAPAVVGLDAANLAGVGAAMDRALLGHSYAKSAIDTACWDILGKHAGLPVCDLLGGRLTEQFPLYFAVPLASVQEMTEYVAARRSEGIHAFQLKIGGDPYEDIARTRSVVESTSAGDTVVCDANGGWGLQDAVVVARGIDDLERVFFEQPCPTLEECLIVRQRTTLPMVLDECITDVHSLLRAYEAKAMEAFRRAVRSTSRASSISTKNGTATSANCFCSTAAASSAEASAGRRRVSRANASRRQTRLGASAVPNHAPRTSGGLAASADPIASRQAIGPRNASAAKTKPIVARRTRTR